MAIKTLVSSFNAGELSPLLESRLGVEKVASGCRVMRNFIPHVHGAVFRRPGLERMGINGGEGEPSRVVGFNFSTTTNFVLELTQGALHVWHSGGRITLVAPVELPYEATELWEVQCAQINDVVYLVHPNHWPRKLVRHADDDWRIEELFAALAGGVVSDPSTITGEAGKLDYARWPWTDFGGANVDTDVLIAAVIASGPPAATANYSSIFIGPFTTNNVARMQFELTVPSSGTWTFQWQGSGRIVVDGVAKDTNRAGALRSFSMSLVAGQRYNVIYWRFLGASPASLYARLRLSGPGYALADVSPSWFKLPDVTVPGTYQQGDFVNQWPPMLDENVTPTTITPSATSGVGITLTASEGIFLQVHVGSYWQIAHRRTTAFSEYVGAVGAFAGSSTALKVLGRWEIFTYGTWSGTLKLERQNSGGDWETIRSWKSNKDRNVTAAGESAQQEVLRLTITTGDGETATGAAVPRFILEAADAKIYGLVKITAVDPAEDGKQATAEVLRALASTDATDLWTEGAWSGRQGYPRALALHEQRLFFGGTRQQPQRIWGSFAADLENFRRSSNDDGALDFVMAAQESNAIQWMVSQGALIVGTAGEEWTVTAVGSDAPLSPGNINVQRQTRFGSAYQQAILINEVAVFIQRTGRRLRQFQYSEATDGYTATDLTVLAEHITRSGIRQMAFQTQKQSILWAVTNDGRLIGMTFEAEQNVFAWHEHVFADSEIDSVAVIYGEQTDEVWVVTHRLHNDKSVREVMRLHPATAEFDAIDPHQLNYLDCSQVVLNATASDTVSGLAHLNNATVDVLVDGAEHPQCEVIDGAITLEREASTVVVGLPMTSELQPMPQELPLNDGSAQGRAWKTPRLAARVYRSMGGEAASAPGRSFEPIISRTPDDLMDTAIPLFTGEKRLNLEARTEDTLNPVIRQQAPLPLNVTALVTTFDVYDR